MIFFFAYFVFTKLYVSFFYKMTINNFVLFIINVNYYGVSVIHQKMIEKSIDYYK